MEWCWLQLAKLHAKPWSGKVAFWSGKVAFWSGKVAFSESCFSKVFFASLKKVEGGLDRPAFTEPWARLAATHLERTAPLHPGHKGWAPQAPHHPRRTTVLQRTRSEGEWSCRPGRAELGPKSTPARKNKYYLPSPFVVFCLEPGHATPFCRGVVRHTTCQLDHCPSISCRVNPRTWFAQGLLSDFCTKEINLPFGMGPQSLPERKRLLMFNPTIPSP